MARIPESAPLAFALCVLFCLVSADAQSQTSESTEVFDSPSIRDQLDRPFRLNKGLVENELLDRRQLGQLLSPLRRLKSPQRQLQTSNPLPPVIAQAAAWEEVTPQPQPTIESGFTLRQQASTAAAPAPVATASPQATTPSADLPPVTESPTESAPHLSQPVPSPLRIIDEPATTQATNEPVNDEPKDDQPFLYGPLPPEEMQQSWEISDSVLDMSIEVLHQEVSSRKAALESSVNLSEQEKSARLNFLGRALDNIGIASQNSTEETRLRQRIHSIDNNLARLESQLAVPAIPQQTDGSLSLEQMQNLLRDLESELDNENQSARKIEDSIQHRSERKSRIPAERIELRRRLDQLHQDMVNNQNNGTDEFTALLALRARELEASTGVELLETESEWLELSQRLFPMQKDLHERTIHRLKGEINQWGEAIAARRRELLQEQIRVAIDKARNAHPTLRELAIKTTKLTEIRVELAEKNKRASAEKFKVETLVHDLGIQQKELEKAVERVGSEGSSNLLIDAHHGLIPPYESMARIRRLKQELLRMKINELKLKQDRRPLVNEEQFITDILGITQDQEIAHTTLKAMARDSVIAHRQQTDELLHEYDDYINILGETESARENLLAQISATRNYIDERALWVQSADRVGLGVLLKSKEGARKYFNPADWMKLGEAITSRVSKKPYESVAGLLGLLVAFTVGRKLKQMA